MRIWIDFRGIPQGFLSQSLTTQIVINETLQIIRYRNSIRFINLYTALYKFMKSYEICIKSCIKY